MEDCINQVKERVSYRTQLGKPIGKHQLIQRHIATMVATSSRRAGSSYQVGAQEGGVRRQPREPRDADRGRQGERGREVRLVEGGVQHGGRAVQCFGGFGYSILSPVTKHLMDTRVARIYEGTDEIMELKIASTVLGRSSRPTSRTEGI